MAVAFTCSGFCGRGLDVPEMNAAHSCGETPPQFLSASVAFWLLVILQRVVCYEKSIIITTRS